MHGKEILKIIILLYTSVITSGFTLSTNSKHCLFAKPGGVVSSDGLSIRTRTTLAAGGGGVEEELEVATSKFESDPNSQKSSATSSPQAKNLVRNVEVEQKWRDAEIAANTQFDLTNLSSLFILIPGKLFFYYTTKQRRLSCIMDSFFLYALIFLTHTHPA
jgi:hypothetical protein